MAGSWGHSPGDIHEDRRKTFLNRAGSPAISLKIWPKGQCGGPDPPGDLHEDERKTFLNDFN